MSGSTHSHGRRHRAGMRYRNHSLVVAAAALVGALALAPAASAAPRAQLIFKTARIESPGNPAVSVVPFTDAVYRSCSVARRRPRAA